MKISVLILNYNGKKITEKAIKSFLKSDFSKKDFEIVVVDNASSDGSVSFLKKKFPKIKMVQNNKNLGSGGINKGLSYCKGDSILFTNNDVAVEPDCLYKLYKALKGKNNIALTAPQYVNYFSKKVEGHGTWVSRSFYSGYKKKQSKEKIIPYIGMGLIKKSVVDKLGYIFDNDYFLYGEDVDLGLRIRLLGLDSIYIPKARMYHMHAVTAEKVVTSSRIIYLMERNLLTTFYKVCSLHNTLFLSPYVYLMRLAALFRDLFTLKFSNAFARLKAIFWIFSHPILLIKKRKETQKNRKVSDKFLFKVFSEKYLF